MWQPGPRSGQARAIGWGPVLCQARDCSGLEPGCAAGHDGAMEKPPAMPSREERLAAKLRENLRRRKVQARKLPSRLREGPGEGVPGEDGEKALP